MPLSPRAMSRKVPLALTIVVAMVAFWFFWESEESQPISDSVHIADAPPSAGRLPPAVGEGGDLAEEGLARESLATDPAAEVAEADWTSQKPVGLRFQGRCLAAEDGRPLRGVLVTLSGSQGNSRLEAEFGPTVWEAPDPIETGPDGRFSFDVSVALAYQFYLTCANVERLTRSARWTAKIPAGTVLDLGDIELMKGWRVHGRVQDADGAPVQTVVRIRSLPMPVSPDMAAGDTLSARSDITGAFEFPSAIPPGTWPVSAEGSGWMLDGPDAIEVSTLTAPPPLVITMRALPRIMGQVFDEDGAPVVSVKVEVSQRRGDRIESGSTKEEGRFTIYQRNPDDTPVSLFVEGSSVQKREFPGLITWGTEGVKLVVERSRSAPIQVVERVSGAAVEEYWVRVGTNPNGLEMGDPLLAGTHPGGSAEVPGLQHGLNYLRVMPKDPALVPSGVIEIDAAARGGDATRIELERLRPLEVVVRLRSGTPVTGSKLRAFDRPLLNEHGWEDARSSNRWISTKEPLAQVLAQAVSDDEGRATLHASVEAEEWFLDANGPHLPATFVIVRPFDQAAPIELVVSTGASIRGTVILPPDSTNKYSVNLRIMNENGQEYGVPGQPRTEELPKDGSFAFLALKPDTYRLYLACFSRFDHPGGGGSSNWVHLDDPLAELTLGADEERNFEFRPLLPECSATVHFLLDGVPLAKRPVSISHTPRDLKHGNWISYGSFLTDSDGRIQVSGLQPGSYLATALIEPEAGSRVELLSLAAAEIVPGTANVCNFEFRRIAARLQLIADESDQPLAGWTSTTSGFERAPMALTAWSFEPLMWVSDEAGFLRFDAMKPGTYRLTAYRDQVRRNSEPFTVSEHASSDAIVLRMKLPQ